MEISNIRTRFCFDFCVFYTKRYQHARARARLLNILVEKLMAHLPIPPCTPPQTFRFERKSDFYSDRYRNFGHFFYIFLTIFCILRLVIPARASTRATQTLTDAEFCVESAYTPLYPTPNLPLETKKSKYMILAYVNSFFYLMSLPIYLKFVLLDSAHSIAYLMCFRRINNDG